MNNKRLPPHSIEAEASVLGSILIDSEAIVSVAELLNPLSFYQKEHQLIYAAMQALYEKRRPIDIVTLTDELKKQRQLSASGGATKLADLASTVSTAANAVYYAQTIADAYTKRRMISLSSQIAEAALDSTKEARDVLDLAEQNIFSVSQQQ